MSCTAWTRSSGQALNHSAVSKISCLPQENLLGQYVGWGEQHMKFRVFGSSIREWTSSNAEYSSMACIITCCSDRIGLLVVGGFKYLFKLSSQPWGCWSLTSIFWKRGAQPAARMLRTRRPALWRHDEHWSASGGNGNTLNTFWVLNFQRNSCQWWCTVWWKMLKC